MKREIKFRIWDKSKNVFVPSDIFGIVNTDFGAFAVMIKDWENYQEGEYFYPYQHELMQFTGLHDKNGKEIYEGDILDGQMVVTWRNDLASFALSKQGWAYDHFFGEAVDPGHTEVIGNIHQNPELLQP